VRAGRNSLKGSDAVRSSSVETWLDRYVIGQAIAGRHMFERQYNIPPARVVIVCPRSDAALEWVCGRQSILVRMV
jgi:hypothetical protein